MKVYLLEGFLAGRGAKLNTDVLLWLCLLMNNNARIVPSRVKPDDDPNINETPLLAKKP